MKVPKETTDALNDFLRAYNQLRDNRGITYFNGELDFEMISLWHKFQKAAAEIPKQTNN